MNLFRRSLGALALALALAGCAAVPLPGFLQKQESAGPLLTPDQAARQFVEVSHRMEPVMVDACRTRRPEANCDFRIVLDTHLGQEPNAFQSVSQDGSPMLIFTLSLITDMRNPDELALVMGHEASHHILNHIALQRANVDAGARAYAQAAENAGETGAAVIRARQAGATLGAIVYSKRYELEADAMGAQLAKKAGYDPLHGALYFLRLPDPGNDPAASHPSVAERMATVKAAVAAMGNG